eukprot:TRINITY_DN1213_c0_g1_i16.p1 TRINITY_DN1213_c0_g1~~TRINITY_DN1213_c0_g1_i16.p1  ORF type:complete len:128 (-),score=20.39 TRINITY_DN1213_c0_g1_i16:303-686(-)
MSNIQQNGAEPHQSTITDERRLKLDDNQLSIPKHNKKTLLWIRAIFFVLATVAVFISKYFILPANDPGCYWDWIMQKLQSLNDKVHEDVALRRSLQISSSVLMDIVYLATLIYWFALSLELTGHTGF